jgi:Ni,Fe-hydrogenase I cytochrome b subunit
MPLPDKYYQQLIERHAAAERASRWDAWRALARVVGEITLWTVLGMLLTGLAFYTHDIQLGRMYWLIGCIVWIGGVSVAVLSAYRRGEERGDW